MVIGFDLSQIAHQGGVAVYTQNLASLLANEKSIQMKFFYSSLRKYYQGNLPNVKRFFIPPTVFEFTFNKLRFPSIETLIGKIDVFHSSDWVQPPTTAKKVTTYHDVIPLKYPQWSHPKVVQVHKDRLKLVEKEVDIVIAVSESTKKDLIEVSKIPEEKIKVIYEGVDDIFIRQKKEDIEKFKTEYSLPQQIILSIGGVGERKNLSRVKKICQGKNLVILGETIKNIPREKLPLLYSSSEVLLYPSLYEGFGLPVLEAMACGTPVITSNVSSLPEVAGDAAIYVNPEDEEEIQEKLNEVLMNNNLKDELTEKGLLQAKKFTWQKCADQTASIYKELINE